MPSTPLAHQHYAMIGSPSHVQTNISLRQARAVHAGSCPVGRRLATTCAGDHNGTREVGSALMRRRDTQGHDVDGKCFWEPGDRPVDRSIDRSIDCSIDSSIGRPCGDTCDDSGRVACNYAAEQMHTQYSMSMH